VVLIKPKSWERHGLKSWTEATRKPLHRRREQAIGILEPAGLDSIDTPTDIRIRMTPIRDIAEMCGSLTTTAGNVRGVVIEQLRWN
jgi:hypothetical protein